MRCVIVLFVAGFTFHGCGSSSTATGSLAASAEVSLSPWVCLDLSTGDVGPVTGLVDPADPQWRGQRILFREIAAGSAVVGRAVADVVTESDEHPQRGIAHDRLWIAALELTQVQWQTMSGTQPWQAVLPFADPSPWIGDDLPAFGLSPRAVESVLADWSRNGWLLDLPETDEWEHACLAGSSGKFAGGDSLDPSTAAVWAVCDNGDDPPRPQVVGTRSANAWGLIDMHGNVWELVRDGLHWQVRGGAWDQPVVTARASNRLAVTDPDTIGWSVGMRPVLRR
jgi:formylglycine-generating enzyme required for sulfatase activity